MCHLNKDRTPKASIVWWEDSHRDGRARIGLKILRISLEEFLQRNPDCFGNLFMNAPCSCQIKVGFAIKAYVGMTSCWGNAKPWWNLNFLFAITTNMFCVGPSRVYTLLLSYLLLRLTLPKFVDVCLFSKAARMQFHGEAVHVETNLNVSQSDFIKHTRWTSRNIQVNSCFI